MVMSEEKLTLKFGGDQEIDMETLSVSLDSTLTTLKAIASSQVEDDEFCRFSG
jgi:hypothetical protein